METKRHTETPNVVRTGQLRRRLTDRIQACKSEEQLPAIFQVRLDWFEGVAAL